MPPAEPDTFIRAHTAIACPPLVPELKLHLATEITPLWQATEAWLEHEGVEPPYWAFAWAGGQALARHLLDLPSLVVGKRVLDFGAGSGLVALAAARGTLVLLGDPGRAYLPAHGLAEVARYTVPTTRELEDRETREGRVWQLLSSRADKLFDAPDARSANRLS